MRARELAIYVRENMLSLGPTFIKIGQLLSTRADLLSPEFVQELSQLQDRVPSFSPEKAVQIVEAELGQTVQQYAPPVTDPIFVIMAFCLATLLHPE